MQVFVEEVGIWMDSLDPLKHVSIRIPMFVAIFGQLCVAFLHYVHAGACLSIWPSYPQNVPRSANLYDTNPGVL